MKKILAWVLLVTMILGMFAGCGNQETPATEPAGEVITAQDAIEYLKALYPKSEDAMKTPVNFDRMGIIRIGGIPFTVVWTTDLPEEQIKVIVSEDGATVTLDVNEKCESDTPYVLTATITDEQGNSASTTWNCVLPQAVDMVSLVKEAYALKSGESLPYEATLTGKIVSIDTVYNPEYKNITVTIAVEGAEDMPVQCYRLKGEGAENLAVGNIITVTGTLKNYNGTIEFDAGCMLDAVEQGDAVTAPTDPGEILKAAYKLKKGKALPYPATLTGKVTSIDKPFDPAYNNISVVITVDGYSKYPILCYRLKGAGAEDIALEDTITVTGIIKNYEGTIEYDAGCMLVERISGGNTAQKPSDDEAKILKDVKKLKDGEKLPYVAILTGQVFSVDEKYTDEYKNITVTMKVSGMRIKAYRMKGDDVKKVKVGDTITVSGQMENYGGVIEFSSGCMMTDRKAGNGKLKVELGPVDESKTYYAEMKQATLYENLYLNGQISDSGYLKTTKNPAEAVKISVEEVSSKGTRFYFMNGETKTYIEIQTNGDKQRPALVTEPTAYWNYDSEYKVYFMDVDGIYCALGTYSTYDTVSATKLGFLSTSNIGKSQFVVKYVTEPSEAPVKPETPEQGVIYVDAPVAGTAYKFVLNQTSLGAKLGFTGEMANTYYFGTSEELDKMVDVYLEEATGGYHIYFMKGNTKTYLNVIPRESDATKTNVVMQTLAQNANPSVYELNTEHKYVKTACVGTDWYLGTYGGNSTISASKTSYISDTSTIGVSQFVTWFATVGEVTPEQPPVTPDEPVTPPVTPDEPVVGVTELKTGDQVVIFAPAYNKALSTETVATYYQKGIDVTVANGEVTGYGATSTWTVTVNSDGSYSFANGGKNIALASSYSSMKLGEVNDDWTLESLGGTLYNIKNVVRGNYMEWYAEKNNWSTVAASNAATDDQFQLSIYVIGKGLLGVKSTEPETPPVTPDEPETPAGVTELKTGDQVVIFAPAYNKALSTETVATYYQKGIDVTVANGEVTGYGATSTWTVTVNSDGSYSFANGGKNIALASSYASMKLGEVNDDWTLEALGGTLFNIKNVVRGNYMEWYAEKNNWSTVAASNAATDDQFQLSIYVIGKGLLTGEGTTPEQPPVTPDEPEQPTDSKFTTTLKNGDKVVIFAPAYNKALSVEKLNASSYYNKGIDVTVDGDTLTGYGETEIWTVVDNGDGTYSFTGNDGKNIAMQASYASLAQGAVNDDWQLIQLANGTCALKNSVRGNYIQWAKSFSNYSTYNGTPETDDQFQLKFYVVESAEPEAPAEPSITTTLTGGTKVVIFAPAYNKALSVEKLNASSYYNKGITVTVDGDTLTGYGETEIWTVVDNGDGTYSFTGNDGKNIAMQASYASLAQGAVNDDWQLIQLANGTCALKNSVRGNYIQWAKSFSNYSTYNGNPETDDQFQLKFYVVEAGEPETPVTPPADPDGTVLTIPEAVAMGSAMADKTFTTTKYKVTGVIDEIVKADYGNVYIKDAAGNRLYVYGIYDITGATSYDALDPKPVVGDTVTLLGVVGNFGGAQMKSGWLQELIPGTPVTPPVTPDEPVTPPATAGGSADFDTIQLPSNKQNGDSSYTATYTTAAGWTSTNSAIQCGGGTINPQFMVIGETNASKAVCMNGKVGASGSITSPTLNGGISKLTIKYTKMFTDTKLGATITVTEVATGNTQTHTISVELPKDEKQVIYTEEWTLETPVSGEFTIKIVNDCPSQNTGNKDRMTILNIDWEGVAPEEPETPPVVGGGAADFDTIELPSNKQNGDSSYTATYTTAAGWTSTNSAIQCGGGTINPQFMVIGETNASKAVCMNGKVGASGTITSPTLDGGISKLTIKYTKMFTDTKLGATITVTEKATGNTQTHTISVELPKDEKQTVYTEEWTLETPVSGEFTIKIVNDCPSQNTGNKDRMTVLSIVWEGAAAVHTHEYVTTTTATCTAAGTTTYTCSCGDTYSEDVEKLGHIDENLDIDCDRAGCTSKVAPAADSTLSVFTANNLGSKLSSSYSYYVEGTIVEVLDAKNGIFLISDGVGTETFYIRLPKNAEGVSHSSWQVKLVLGDKIKVYGKINKFTTSSAPNGSYYPASQGGVVTILEQHPHTFGDPTCTKPGYCECGQSGPAALNHIDANSDNACDRCSWNMKHAIEVLTTKCDDIKNTDKLDTTNGTATFESANFKATFAKGTGSFNTSGTDHMRFYKNNALTVESTGGKKIAGFAFVSSSDSYVDELEAVLTAAGYEYVKDGTKLTIMISATESFNLPNSSTKNARIAAIEIIYEK